MLLFLVMSLLTINHIVTLLYLPFLLPNYIGFYGELLLILMNVSAFTIISFNIIAFIRYTKKYIKQNADSTKALDKEKHRVKSISDIKIEKCGKGLWQFYVNDNTYEIKLKGYMFQLSFVMAIMVRLLYYRYIKHGLERDFAKYAKVPLQSLEIQIQMPRHKIINKKLVRHNHLWFGLISQAICRVQIKNEFYYYSRNYLFYRGKYERVKYTEEWWLRG